MGTPLTDKGAFLTYNFTCLNEKDEKKIVKFNEIMNGLSIPVLCIVGTNDFIVKVNDVKALLKDFKLNIELQVFEGLNHYLIKGEDIWFTNKSSIILSKLYLIDNKPLQAILSWVNEI